MNPLKRLETDEAVFGLLNAWELLRTQHRELPAQAVTVLFYVASHNRCHKQAIEEDCSLTTASSSRMIDLLADGYGRKGVITPGLGLITKYIDGSNRRRTQLKLTPKGEALIARIKGIVYG